MDKRSRSFDLLMCFFIFLCIVGSFVWYQVEERKRCELEKERLRGVISEQEKALESKPDVLAVPEQKPEKPKLAKGKRQKVRAELFAHPQMPPVSNAPIKK